MKERGEIMIYITGDCHGDYRRFNKTCFPEQHEMTKRDHVIIAGDFGFWRDDPEQAYWMKWLNERSFTTLWIDGNHENYDLLAQYPVEMWNGGLVQFIAPSVLHLCRGQVFEIDGCRIFTFGGASSHDIAGGILEADDPHFNETRRRLNKENTPYRINHVSWWKEEMPDQKEMALGRENLKRHHDEVDVMITHCCASSTQAILSGGSFQPDKLTDYLEELKRQIKFKRWFFGHYHDNKAVSDKEILLYEQIIRIW